MLISVVNRTRSISDVDLQRVVRAINRQIAEDFQPYWSISGRLRLEGKVGDSPDVQTLSDLRGEAVIYLWDETDVKGALGYHDRNANGIPYGFVFTALSKQLGEPWSVTLSHEVLELLGDPQGNLLVQGPHPVNPEREVYHWFEMCDAVQSQGYEVDGVQVANFILPLYFTQGGQPGARNDYLGTLNPSGDSLASFGVAEGGYIGYYDPISRTHQTYVRADDAKARQRMAVKASGLYGRGFLRKQNMAAGPRLDTHLKALAASAQAPVAPVADPIQHVVVLMLENQSFDRLLGGMSRINPNVEGVRGEQQQPYANPCAGRAPVAQTARRDYVIKRDVDHEHAGAIHQIASGEMSGFVQSFLDKYPDATDEELAQVMGYFPFGATPEGDSLPVIHQLAREFAVCDHWFSAMPGPTWQNRFFVHSATSLGHVMMPSKQTPGDMHIYYQETVYDRLSDAGIPWKIFHDGVPQSIVLTRLLTRYLTWRGYEGMDEFFKLAQGPAEQFPAYAFIEPAYFGQGENDQHPPADMRDGERLIAQVYNALRSNQALWESTLLVVLYDEHGGFYDHVGPPATVPPDAYTGEWSFDRLGVRVPAILVSPWVDKGVIKTVFDHTSLLRYLCDKWALPPLGQRMQAQAGTAQANSFAAELKKRSTPRTDTPAHLPVTGSGAGAVLARSVPDADRQEPPIEGSREALLAFVDSLPEPVGAERTAPAGMRAAMGVAAAVPLAPALAAHEAALDKLERLRQMTPKP